MTKTVMSAVTDEKHNNRLPSTKYNLAASGLFLLENLLIPKPDDSEAYFLKHVVHMLTAYCLMYCIYSEVSLTTTECFHIE